jgi:transposase InsO family protein
MVDLLRAFVSSLLVPFRSRIALQAENLALRHQLAVYQRSAKRPRIRPADRALWACLSRIWSGWRGALFIVQPKTVIAWRRRKLREHWTKLTRSGKPGRPAAAKEVRDLIRRLSAANSLWGSPRILGELSKIGIVVAKSTVEKYMVRRRKAPSPTWRAFLNNHARDLIAIDFFVVPTVRHRILYVFVVLAHERRRVLHFNVTSNPTSEWTAQQIVEAFPWELSAKYLLRDRDKIYGDRFRKRVHNMGFDEILIAPRSPWQNPFVERLIGSIRRECLDHVLVLSERHLRRVVSRYVDYYHSSRTHLSLEMDCPEHRTVHEVDRGRVIEIPKVGGLHHHYERRAA